jgi:hypothetical protein
MIDRPRGASPAERREVDKRIEQRTCGTFISWPPKKPDPYPYQ